MTRLQKALQNWTHDGGNQTAFSELAGIERSMCSRLFNGKSKLDPERWLPLFERFEAAGRTREALVILRAAIEDLIPEPIRRHVRLDLTSPSTMKDAKLTRQERAKLELLRALEQDDPDTIALAIALQAWDRRKK